MLAVTDDIDRQAQCPYRCIDRPRAAAVEENRRAVLLYLQCHSFAVGAITGGRQLVGAIDDRAVLRQVLGREQFPQLPRAELLAGRVGGRLHHAAEFDLQAPWQHELVIALQEIGDPALPRLTVYPDDRLVRAAEVRRVDRQIRDIPDAVRIQRGQPFLDGVLVGAGASRKHEVADVRMTRMNGKLVAGFRAMRDRIDVGKVELRIDALGVQVHRERYDIDVTGALTVTKQRAFDALGASHHGEFGGGYAGPAIVVRVDADDDTVTTRDVA